MRMFDTLVQASGTNFSIFRNSNKIATVKGLYYDELSIDLPFDCDVRIGDVILNEVTEEKIVVGKLKKELTVTGDGIDFIHASATSQIQTQPSNIVYNVGTAYGTAYGSAFGPNASSTYQSTSIDDLRKIIAANTIDKGKFNELIEALEKCSQKGSYDQSSLGKFSSLLQKNSWLTEPVANFILSKLFG